MSSPQISIIVPVYNVEKYLCRCLDSILAQTFTDWECILVDDGSTDRSGKICDEYAKNDVRFKVIHKENNGVSSARNVGLDNAKGEWITFIDADDWIGNLYLETLIGYTNKSDVNIVQMSFTTTDGFVGKTHILNKETFDFIEYANRLLSRDRVRLEVWGKLYKHNLLFNIRFDESIKIGEDWLFLIQLAVQENGFILQVPSPFYFYFDNKKSAMHIIGNDVEKTIETIKKTP